MKTEPSRYALVGETKPKPRGFLRKMPVISPPGASPRVGSMTWPLLATTRSPWFAKVWTAEEKSAKSSEEMLRSLARSPRREGV
jgi:hypothetical protein